MPAGWEATITACPGRRCSGRARPDSCEPNSASGNSMLRVLRAVSRSVCSRPKIACTACPHAKLVAHRQQFAAPRLMPLAGWAAPAAEAKPGCQRLPPTPAWRGWSAPGCAPPAAGRVRGRGTVARCAPCALPAPPCRAQQPPPPPKAQSTGQNQVPRPRALRALGWQPCRCLRRRCCTHEWGCCPGLLPPLPLPQLPPRRLQRRGEGRHETAKATASAVRPSG